MEITASKKPWLFLSYIPRQLGVRSGYPRPCRPPWGQEELQTALCWGHIHPILSVDQLFQALCPLVDGPAGRPSHQRSWDPALHG